MPPRRQQGSENTENRMAVMGSNGRHHIIPDPAERTRCNDPDFFVQVPPPYNEFLSGGIVVHHNHQPAEAAYAKAKTEAKNRKKEKRGNREAISGEALIADSLNIFQIHAGVSIPPSTKLEASNGVVIFVPQNVPQLAFEEMSDARLHNFGACQMPVETWRPTLVFLPPTGGNNAMMISGASPQNVVITTLSQKEEGHKPSNNEDSKRAAFSAYVAGAEVGDAACHYLFFPAAHSYAFERKKYAEFAAALDMYIEAIEAQCSHRTVAHDVAYFAVEAGECHDAAYQATGSQHERKKATLSYKRAAEACMEDGAVTSASYPAHAWNCLGLSLKRAGEMDMALRAYVWALYVGVKHNDPDASMKDCVTQNLCTLISSGSQSRSERKAMDDEMMRYQTKIIEQRVKHTTMGVHLTEKCLACQATSSITSASGRLLVCSKCKRATYCSPACQKLHWPEHKALCKKWVSEESEP